MTAHIRWGLLSTANINRRLIPAIRASRRGELVAVASRTQERAGAYARDWDIPHAFGSYEALLTSGAVDAVYISLPKPPACRMVDPGARTRLARPLRKAPRHLSARGGRDDRRRRAHRYGPRRGLHVPPPSPDEARRRLGSQRAPRRHHHGARRLSLSRPEPQQRAARVRVGRRQPLGRGRLPA
jgi:hypothetical protein